MKLVTAIAVALMLTLAAVGAWAEEVQGKIQTVDPSERTIVLEDGTKIWIAEGVSMDNVKEGAAVKASYEERDGKKVATKLEVSQ
ncbi:MAG TPA: DUF1344 domain-containing protein [Methylomirabilota bacterium]|nr:DUF1344 domain-containing protein [Methylomirabilota bacterium]